MERKKGKMNFEFDSMIPLGVEQIVLAGGQLAIIRNMKNKIKCLSKRNRIDLK